MRHQRMTVVLRMYLLGLWDLAPPFTLVFLMLNVRAYLTDPLCAHRQRRADRCILATKRAGMILCGLRGSLFLTYAFRLGQ